MPLKSPKVFSTTWRKNSLDTRSRVSRSFTNNSLGIYDMISKIAMYDAWYASSVYKCIGQIDMNAVCRYLT